MKTIKILDILFRRGWDIKITTKREPEADPNKWFVKISNHRLPWVTGYGKTLPDAVRKLIENIYADVDGYKRVCAPAKARPIRSYADGPKTAQT